MQDYSAITTIPGVGIMQKIIQRQHRCTISSCSRITLSSISALFYFPSFFFLILFLDLFLVLLQAKMPHFEAEKSETSRTNRCFSVALLTGSATEKPLTWVL